MTEEMLKAAAVEADQVMLDSLPAPEECEHAFSNSFQKRIRRLSRMACFQGGGIPGKIQQGSAWWFNDSRPGMRAQLTSRAANGVLGQFVGMLTDSRSFLSYTRHEYFRRILCELLGEWVESGQYPNDRKQLEKLVANLCYYNTKGFFNFSV